jgi:DNA invertase Pin-like site-specific DNA recombinase
MRYAYSYIRMSTDIQLKGDSLRRQLEKSAAYANEHGLTLIDHIGDKKLHDIGQSGFKGQNVKQGMLGRFIAALESGEIPQNSVLLVESLDRLTREKITEALELFLKIVRLGVEIVTIMDGQRYSKERLDENPYIIFISLGVMMRANDESETKSSRIKAIWEKKRRHAAEKPITSLAPAWLKLNKRTWKFEEVPERVEVVKKIFDMCLNGQGVYAIARYLNEQHVPLFGKSKFWHFTYIRKILTNRAVLGEFEPKTRLSSQHVGTNEVIKDYFPKIVDEMKFNLAKAALESRATGSGGRKGKSFTNIFNGLLYCCDCGDRMLVKDRGVGKNSVKTVACSRSLAKSSCSMPEWKLQEVEQSLLLHFRDIDFSSLRGTELKSRLASLADQITSLQISVADNEKAIARNIAFIQATDLSDSMQKILAIELSRLEAEFIGKKEALVNAQAEHELCAESERQMDSGQLKTLLNELKARQDDYDFRAAFNNALRMAISKIELARDPFVFNPWEYNETDIAVIGFRSECPSRKKLSLNEVRKRIKFAKYCESLARRIVVRYKNGATRHVEVGTGLTYATPNFKRRPENKKADM